MSTNLEYRAGERQRKRESRRQASEAQREKSKGDIFLLEVQHENLERLFKRSYKICIRSVILGELVLNESFRNYKRFSLIFPEHFRGNLMYYEYYYF